MKYSNVIAAIDTSDDAKQVLDAALQLSLDHDAQLSLITVLKPFIQVYGGIDTPTIARIEHDSVVQATERLTHHAHTLGLEDDRVFVVQGHAPTEIRNLANELDASLIVMGTHGRHGMQRMMLGSTASGVLHGTDCDVFAVRIKDEAA